MSDPNDRLGATLAGRYRVERNLGGGAMGVVYLAHDTRLDRPVAIKFLASPPSDSPVDDDLEPRFLAEARAVSAVDHPNVGAVHEVDRTEGGQLYIVMAYHDGETLKERLARGPMTVEDVLDVGAQLAAGLGAAHAHGVIHRDVKPANVIITADGVVKIIDFGIAKSAATTDLTRTGQTLGTVSYMSPEQATGEAVDARSDLWSLGVILYEMLAGHTPFRGPHALAVLHTILHDEPEPLEDARADLPESLERIIDHCLAKRPDARAQSAGEVADALATTRANGSAPAAHRGSRRPGGLAYAGLAVVVLGAIAAAAVLLGGRGREPIDSIAVIPFENQSGDPERDYFVGGMQEALINSLGQVEALRVTSRTSTLRYADGQATVPEIAAELGVDAIVEGAVFTAGDTVRISVQLVDGRTDAQIWSDHYDRDVRDVLELFNEIAGSVAEEVQVALSTDEAAQLAAAPRVDPRLLDLYMRGREAFATLSPAGFALANERFDEALRIDSTFARAWAGKAGTLVLQAYMGILPPRGAMAEARRTAQRAVDLDDGLAPGHTALGWVLLVALQLDSAAVEFRRALEFNPNDVDALHGYGDYLTVTGDPEGGLRYVERASALDPYSPIWGHAVAGHLHMMRRFDDAIAEANEVRARFPQSPVLGFRAAAYWELGRYEEALADFREAARNRPDVLASVDAAYASGGPDGAIRAFADAAAARAEASGIGAFATALWYGRARDADLALEWLTRAYEVESPDFYQAGIRPEFAFLDADPRFRELLGRAGLTRVVIAPSMAGIELAPTPRAGRTPAP